VLALRNGRPTANVPVSERGLAYGDGLFETLKVVAGHPQFLALHLERLQRDCIRLDMRLDIARLRREIAEILRDAAAATAADGVLKLIVTRSSSMRGYQAPRNAAAERLAVFYPLDFPEPARPSPGVQVRLCRLRLAEQPALAGMKHLNRLEQVRARAEWSDAAIAEGLLLDSAGRLIEGVASNVFLVRDGEVLTPRLQRCGVAGVIRELLLRNAGAIGLSIRELDLSLDDLLHADEIFLTNSIVGIQPVLKVDCLHKPRGDVTIALQNYFQTLCSRDALENVVRIADQ
jgi:4-amino-4-deoxychorismate lyase